MSNSNGTVMGPASIGYPAGYITPPQPKTGTDKLKWREEIRFWMETVKTAAEAGDTKAVGVSATLGLTLFRSLDDSRKEIVKKAMRTGEIILISKGPNSVEKQMAVVSSILKVVAPDSAVEKIKRIVNLNKEVHRCTRKDSEDMTTYIERFNSLAQRYLNVVTARHDSEVSQNFAITLLTNAKVSEQTFSNLISSLINNAKHRELQEKEVVMSKTRAKDMLETLVKIGNGENLNAEKIEA